jgi:hypothetical protein
LDRPLVAVDRKFAGQQTISGIQSKQTLSSEQVAVAYAREFEQQIFCSLLCERYPDAGPRDSRKRAIRQHGRAAERNPYLCFR